MGQRSRTACDDVIIAATSEIRNNLTRQINENCSDAQTVAGTRDTRKMMGPKDDRRDQNYQRFKEDETLKCLMKKAGFGVNVTTNSKPFPLAKKTFPPSFGSKVKPLSSEESIKLFSSLSKKRRHSDSSQRKILHVQIQRNERQTNQSELSPGVRHNLNPDVLTPREKVLEALNHFRMVFEDVDRDKAARGATYQTDLYTRDILIEDMKQVNSEKRVGVVPGVEVGDKFKYKTQLNIIGLHFGMSRGIDYMKKEGLYIATSIVISEGSAYKDEYNSYVVIYCGEGDYSKRKKLKPVEDQKMT